MRNFIFSLEGVCAGLSLHIVNRGCFQQLLELFSCVSTPPHALLRINATKGELIYHRHHTHDAQDFDDIV